ncbi:MAG: chromate transporter [Bacteroidales bacterium]|nr:chromate transporter [Bacteroidales bacterium]
MTAKYCELFYTFFKVGAFTIGGGYAMLPLIEREVVDRRGWLGREEFLDYIALSQAMPGVLAVNVATVVGYKLRGIWGSVVAIAGNIMMPILFILLLAIGIRYVRMGPVAERFFMGVRPAVVALIAAPVFTLARSAGLNWRNCWVPVLSALLIWLMGVSPVAVILVAAVAGFVLGKVKSHKVQ